MSDAPETTELIDILRMVSQMRTVRQFPAYHRGVEQAIQRLKDLEKEVAHERYEHYVTCDSEGLHWYGDPPPKPEE